MKGRKPRYCKICTKYIGEYYPSQQKSTCSAECLSKAISRATTGYNNSNYKKGEYYKGNYCLSCGKRLTPGKSYCYKCSGVKTMGIYYRSEEIKKITGIKSSTKFTKEFKKRFRKIMEKRGYWIPLKRNYTI